MPILAKFPKHRRRRRRGRRRLRSLSLLPTVMTLGNLICGFAAISFALRAMHDLGAGNDFADVQTLRSPLLELMLPSYLSIGAGLVILGMIFDLFDGLLARVTRSITNFGGQLDSLADVVTSGVAPATLMIASMTTELAPSPISGHFFGRAAWVSAAVFVAFAAIRLARFNVEHGKEDFDHRSFLGMPTPGAACVIVSMILFQDQVGAEARRILVYAMPPVAIAIAFLMVSRIPYRRFHRAFFLGKKPFSHVITFVVVFAVFWSWKAPTLVVLVAWYAISGPLFLLLKSMREPGSTANTPDEQPQQAEEQQAG